MAVKHKDRDGRKGRRSRKDASTPDSSAPANGSAGADNQTQTGPQTRTRAETRTRAQTKARPPVIPGQVARDVAVTALRLLRENSLATDAAITTAIDTCTHGTQSPKALEPRDRNLARLIVMTVLRRQGSIDALLATYLERGLPSRSGCLRDSLTIAVAQLIVLQIKPHAVINIAVEQCRADRRAAPFAKLANAVLRRISETGGERFAAIDPVAHDIPSWMLKRWQQQFGPDTANEIARASLQEAGLDLTVPGDAQAVATALDGVVLPTGSVRIKAEGRIDVLPGYDDGTWWIQDAAATLPAQLLPFEAGARVLDICAAPGGKTAQLSARGASVIALDKSATRLKRLRDNLERLHLEAEIVAADALAWEPNTQFDAILLDAPCSATGTIRRHPEILRNRTESALGQLAGLQARLLERAASWLRPGGYLVVCTCSLEHEEGPSLVERARLAELGLVLDPINPARDQIEAEFVTSEGFLRTLPCHWPTIANHLAPGLDGFFAARLRRPLS